MDTLEAYNLTIDKIEELKREGINSTSVPSRSRGDRNLIKKYNSPKNVKPDKWFHVTFNINDEVQADKIFDAVKYLGLCGIQFDTGGYKNTRDWELDWSFEYTGKENEEWMQKVEEVEYLIRDLKD
jgi:hypothetical protein